MESMSPTLGEYAMRKEGIFTQFGMLNWRSNLLYSTATDWIVNNGTLADISREIWVPGYLDPLFPLKWNPQEKFPSWRILMEIGSWKMEWIYFSSWWQTNFSVLPPAFIKIMLSYRHLTQKGHSPSNQRITLFQIAHPWSPAVTGNLWRPGNRFGH